ncbi:MAG: CHAT domain-containing protein, partial [Deltaproteobacteria bacterium]|nr:CHAT domain-containing protein [Deltaproteobacteria bacterium]
MDEDKNKDTEPQAETIEQVLRERERLDQVLHRKFRKKMAVVFTDVCGYTQFMSTMGDIRGRAWMQKHHDIVLPLIESHGGTVLDIMGDGVMASFPITLDAAKATMAIQEDLHEYNSKPDTIDEIHVTIGINAGAILADKDHIAGDVVNVASRIESEAEKDQILLSRAVYEDIRHSADILCRYQGTAKVKGKTEPLELYRLVWRDEDVILSEEARVAPFDQEIRIRGIQPFNVLHIDVARGEDGLKISAYEQIAGHGSTVRHYDEIPAPMDKINARCLEIVETLNKANRRGLVHRDILMKLKELGQVFCDDLFSHTVKDLISQTTAEYLNIDIDDQFVQIPWELLHDGGQFLCQRFCMGRLVRTRQNVTGGIRALGRPLKMLILADPKGDLKGAYSEGSQILKSVDPQTDFINASFQSENITPDFIREKIRNFDMVHFAGHADYNPNNPGESGWRLMDGIFRAQDIIKMAGTSAMPALVFSNACQSARTEEWDLKEHFQDEIFGLANAFVLAGVKHYIGTFWEILDEPSSHFSLEFYKELLAGMTIGAAMRQARLSLINKYGEETIVWGSYLLYGDPAYNYMDQIKMIEAEEEPEPSYAPSPEVETRAPEKEEIIDFADKEVPKKKKAWLGLIAAGVIFCLGVLFWGYQGYLKNQTEKYMTAARQKYDAGNFDAALNTCKILEDKNSELRLIYL